MSMIAEEDVDDDAVGLHGRDGNRLFSRHDSSSSSNLPTDEHANEQDDEEGAYSSASGSGTEGDEDDDDDEHLPPQPPISQHTFAPPFYGRPPTPLPPSPSLTSLLRPSRPTTPDVSDDDNATGTGVGHGGAGSSEGPVPRARPKVPTYEYYGFVLYLFSSLSFLIYLLWSYLPSPFLHALGIYYYPNRWWSLAIPSFLVMLLVYIYVALAGYNLEILTLPLESVETVVDEAAMVAVVDGKGRILRGDQKRRWGLGGGEAGSGSGSGSVSGSRKKGGGRDAGRRKKTAAAAIGKVEGGSRGRSGLNWREVWNEGTDAVMDVPLAGVCEVLYGEGRDWDSEVEGEEVVITRV